jgi:hypothetical protein
MKPKCFNVPDKGCQNCISVSCLKDFKFLKNLDFVKAIGSGLQGIVVLVCDQDKSCTEKKAVKISILNSPQITTITSDVPTSCSDIKQKMLPPNTMKRLTEKFVKSVNSLEIRTFENFQKEVDASVLASEIGIGPVVYETGVCRSAMKAGVYEKFDIGIIVMEFLETTLYDFFRKYPEDFILKFFIFRLEILCHVKKAYKHGMYHEDLHLNNMMIDERGRIRIIDWGKSDKDPSKMSVVGQIKLIRIIFDKMMRKALMFVVFGRNSVQNDKKLTFSENPDVKLTKKHQRIIDRWLEEPVPKHSVPNR